MPAVIIRDQSHGSQATVLPELGFNLFQFSTIVAGQSVDVIEADDDFELGKTPASRCGIPILFPFPNRIDQGKYSWEGKEYQIPVSHPGDHAIHGFCMDRPWRVTDQSENSVTGEFQLSKDAPDRLEYWPADFIIQCTYLLIGSTLKSRFTFINPDTKSLPWGFGTHAYFKLPLTQASSAEHIVLYAPAHKQWLLSNFIPTGEMVDVSESKDLTKGGYYLAKKMDDVLTDLRPDGDALECTIVDEQAGLEMVQACDKRFRELVVYMPPGREAVCMEPYTCPTDAINLEAKGIPCGWETLAPGESVSTWIDMCVNPVIA